MTREQFIARWRAHVAGTIAIGAQSVRKSLAGAHLSSETLGEGLLEITTTTDRLLGQIYDSLFPPKPAAPPQANGQVGQQQQGAKK